MATVVVYIAVFVNGQHAGWEGRYVSYEEGDVLAMIVKEAVAELKTAEVSGLIGNSDMALMAWWHEAGNSVREQRKIDAALLEANQLAPFQAGLGRGRLVSEEG